MALFNLNDLSHAFGGAPVLDHVNFQVDPGERVCLVGRNGAGKSTLMRIIAGEMAPDSGAVSRQPHLQPCTAQEHAKPEALQLAA